MKQHKDQGVASLTQLHETHMRRFLAVWREAKAQGLTLHVKGDPDYASLESLLVHVVGCARGYMVWICKVLELPDPGMAAVPPANEIEGVLDEYVDKILEQWEGPLCDVASSRLHRDAYRSTWGVLYCIDAMLEHAVMHPVRHTFQLENLMGAKS